MTTPLAAMLEHLSEVAKQKLVSDVVCPTCGDRYCFIKHGHYRRYLFAGSDTVKIQRYRCRNPDCPRGTFSCLPHPFLPVIRLPLCALITILTLVEKENTTIAAVARSCAKSWAVIQRAVDSAQKLRGWLAKPAQAALWGPSPCLCPKRHWGAFTRALSFAFFPERF